MKQFCGTRSDYQIFIPALAAGGAYVCLLFMFALLPFILSVCPFVCLNVCSITAENNRQTLLKHETS